MIESVIKIDAICEYALGKRTSLKCVLGGCYMISLEWGEMVRWEPHWSEADIYTVLTWVFSSHWSGVDYLAFANILHCYLTLVVSPVTCLKSHSFTNNLFLYILSHC